MGIAQRDEVREAIDAGDDIVRRLRARADDIERDIVELRRRVPAAKALTS